MRTCNQPSSSLRKYHKYIFLDNIVSLSPPLRPSASKPWWTTMRPFWKPCWNLAWRFFFSHILYEFNVSEPLKLLLNHCTYFFFHEIKRFLCLISQNFRIQWFTLPRLQLTEAITVKVKWRMRYLIKKNVLDKMVKLLKGDSTKNTMFDRKRVVLYETNQDRR